jgi:demethylmenaquinone methyltransferase/2-methoxy-6-polyprenyl-1,4-benzoquinol methylase
MKWSFLPLGGEMKCRAELISHIQFSNNERILDMCCGTGGSTCSIVKRACINSNIFGIDISSGQVKMAAKRGRLKNVQLIVCDAANTGFADGSFNKVFITHALHEMKRNDRLTILNEAARILKDKGSIIILELDRPSNLWLRIFFGFWFFYWLPFNFETPTRKDMLKQGLVNELKISGFRDLKKAGKYNGVLQTIQGSKFFTP